VKNFKYSLIFLCYLFYIVPGVTQVDNVEADISKENSSNSFFYVQCNGLPSYNKLKSASQYQLQIQDMADDFEGLLPKEGEFLTNKEFLEWIKSSPAIESHIIFKKKYLRSSFNGNRSVYYEVKVSGITNYYSASSISYSIELRDSLVASIFGFKNGSISGYKELGIEKNFINLLTELSTYLSKDKATQIEYLNLKIKALIEDSSKCVDELNLDSITELELLSKTIVLEELVEYDFYQGYFLKLYSWFQELDNKPENLLKKNEFYEVKKIDASEFKYLLNFNDNIFPGIYNFIVQRNHLFKIKKYNLDKAMLDKGFSSILFKSYPYSFFEISNKEFLQYMLLEFESFFDNTYVNSSNLKSLLLYLKRDYQVKDSAILKEIKKTHELIRITTLEINETFKKMNSDDEFPSTYTKKISNVVQKISKNNGLLFKGVDAERVELSENLTNMYKWMKSENLFSMSYLNYYKKLVDDYNNISKINSIIKNLFITLKE